MRHRKTGAKAMFTGSALLLVCPLLFSPAQANSLHKVAVSTSTNIMYPQNSRSQAYGVTKSPSVAYSTQYRGSDHGSGRVAHAVGISCVPFARMESGIAVGGNAWQWWDNAAGTYARGATPEPGSVLAFRANGRMRLGHVAVVARVINPRQVLIDHANWPNGGGRGGVSEAIPVVDVSEANDWSAVRVALGASGDFGSVYPTYGFIYDRPDNGAIEAHRGATAEQMAELNPAPRDLRKTTPHAVRRYEEVAEAPLHARRRSTVVLTPR